MEIRCELCGKTGFKNAQGLRGHKTFVHGQTVSDKITPVARVATEQPLSLLEDRLSKLERITGLRESDSGFSLASLGEPRPLTERLTQITERLSKKAEQLSELSDIVSELTKVVEPALQDLGQKFESELNSLAAVVNRNRDAFNYGLSDVKSRIDKVQKMVDDLSEGLSTVRTKLAAHGHDDLKSVPELVAKVGNLEQTVGTVRSQVEYLARVAKREATGNTVQLRLTDGKEHTFREYRSTRGLTKPHQSSIDLILGRRWVDLAEPED